LARSSSQSVLKNYVGSVATDCNGTIVAASAPKGNLITYWDVSTRNYLGSCSLNDSCGLAPTHRQASFLLTSGEGWLATGDANGDLERESTAFQWDNPRNPRPLRRFASPSGVELAYSDLISEARFPKVLAWPGGCPPAIYILK